MRRTAFAALVAAMTAAPAAASTMVVEQLMRNTGFTGWTPDVTAYFGQRFTVPDAPVLESFTFYIGFTTGRILFDAFVYA